MHQAWKSSYPFTNLINVGNMTRSCVTYTEGVNECSMKAPSVAWNIVGRADVTVATPARTLPASYGKAVGSVET